MPERSGPKEVAFPAHIRLINRRHACAHFRKWTGFEVALHVIEDLMQGRNDGGVISFYQLTTELRA